MLGTTNIVAFLKHGQKIGSCNNTMNDITERQMPRQFQELALSKSRKSDPTKTAKQATCGNSALYPSPDARLRSCQCPETRTSSATRGLSPTATSTSDSCNGNSATTYLAGSPVRQAVGTLLFAGRRSTSTRILLTKDYLSLLTWLSSGAKTIGDTRPFLVLAALDNLSYNYCSHMGSMAPGGRINGTRRINRHQVGGFAGTRWRIMAPGGGFAGTRWRNKRLRWINRRTDWRINGLEDQLLLLYCCCYYTSPDDCRCTYQL